MKPIKNIMIDLETLGTTGRAHILTIGAAAFDCCGVQDMLHIHVQPSSNIDHGREISIETVKWWLKRHEQFAENLVNDVQVPLGDALDMLSRWASVAAEDSPSVWSNGTDFDLAILRSAYRATQKPIWFEYWQQRDYRTLRMIAHGDLGRRPREARHHAMDDAIAQAEHTVAICKAMGIEL